MIVLEMVIDVFTDIGFIMEDKGRIILNRIRTPDGTVLTSFYRHDFNSHKDKNGELYTIDGGVDYLKRSLNIIPYIDLTIYENDPFDFVRKSFHRWDGEVLKKYVPMCDMSENWLDNLIIWLKERTEKHEFPLYLYLKEKRYRVINDLLEENPHYVYGGMRYSQNTKLHICDDKAIPLCNVKSNWMEAGEPIDANGHVKGAEHLPSIYDIQEMDTCKKCLKKWENIISKL